MHYYGHFYKIRTTGNRILYCRSVLEITAHQPLIPNELLDRQPDAVVVMMNPGSSRPRQAVEQQVLNSQNIQTRCRLVSAIHDKTQNQIVKIMGRVGYNHIRVINLSDIREPKSQKFFKTVSREITIQNNHIQAPHSIFSRYRFWELRCRMNPRSGIVIAGWGKGWNRCQWKNSFAERCFDMIRALGFRIIGYQDYDRDDHIFIHPLYNPIMNNWPDCIVSQICGNLCDRRRI